MSAIKKRCEKDNREELEGKKGENTTQFNEIARLNIRICDLVKANKQYEGQVKVLESLNAAKKKMDAEKVSRTQELSSTKVELELAKQQVLLSIISEEHCP